MHTTPIYIKGLAQISIQRPLCDDWMQNGVAHNEAYVRADDPNFRDFLAPLEARRMGRLLKRAAVVAETALKEGATTCPDAIFSGTGLGCVESTEKFLETLCREGEHLLSPAHFMQSTHNTISSLIAIRTHCHGANTTFSHKTFSFEQALHEAIMSLRLAECSNALVGGYDEVTPSYYTLLRRAGYVGHPQQVACSETAMAALISTEREGAVARLDAFQMGQATQEGESATRLKDYLDNCGISPDDIDAVVTGHNGVANNDARYAALCMACLPGIPQLPYNNCLERITPFRRSLSMPPPGCCNTAHGRLACLACRPHARRNACSSLISQPMAAMPLRCCQNDAYLSPTPKPNL